LRCAAVTRTKVYDLSKVVEVVEGEAMEVA
jgi:hypothetical protein